MQSLPILRNFASQERQIPGFIGIDANPHGLTDRPRLGSTKPAVAVNVR